MIADKKPQINTDEISVMQKFKGYDILEHTADIGIRAYGKTRKELFINAATGMFGIIADLDDVRIIKTVPIRLKAPSLEELLVLWLQELLYRFDIDKILFKKFAIERMSETQLIAKVSGERLDADKHTLYRELKAVTYHELKIERLKTTWQARVIFDI